MNLNKVFLIGRLVQEVDFKITPNGTQVAFLNIATNRIYKDKNNQNVKETEFHKIIAWGKLAETCRNYLNKGRLILVEGRIHYRNWLTPNGEKRTTTEIIAENITFGPKSINESEDIEEDLTSFENTFNQDNNIWDIQF
ncbi:MAG: single-stranded DNA-binding protein [Candidatus Parcubacteria bacterium]|nr:MAG: single-stranded DNA-binding protein [Candidatus Parcubacteria bacterium]